MFKVWSGDKTCFEGGKGGKLGGREVGECKLAKVAWMVLQHGVRFARVM